MSQIRHTTFRASSVSCVHTTTEKPDGVPMHTHEVYELILVKSGKGYYVVEDRRYPLQKNTLIITHPSNVHRILIESKEQPYERYVLMYDPQQLLPKLYDAIPKDLDILYLDSNHIIVELIRKMDFYCQRLQGEALERLMNILMEVIFFNISLASGQSAQQRVASSNPLIQRAVTYIEENITTLSGIEEICNALFITKSHLHHLFMDHLQITPKKYILSKRLSLAQRAIRSGMKPTVAYQECGFRNYITFYRDYKSFYGHCPSEEPALPSIPDVIDEQV